MTLLDIYELKNKIEQHREFLMDKELSVDNIYESLEVLVELEAHIGLINTWYDCNKSEIERIVNILQEK